MRRRTFLGSISAAVALPSARVLAGPKSKASSAEVLAVEKGRVVKQADRYLADAPITITASSSPRSAGGLHDFFSEGDYWWPDPKNPKGPYVQRDGMSNPANFVEHRKALMRLSVQVPALAAAWLFTRERKYAEHAALHLRAWFLDPKTVMNPHLKYSQAIGNMVTGRSIGVIDTLHLVEVARAISVLEPAMNEGDRRGVKQWFVHYLDWLTTHEYGTTERDAKNNHGTCWVLQAAEFAHLTGNAAVTDFCRNRFKTVLLPNQLAADGSFPQELRRTKPYGYSLFQLDVIGGVCQVLSTPKDDLWAFTLPDGRNMGKALGFMVPFIADKKRWPHKPDVMYFDAWPIRHPVLAFGALALDRPEYLDLWKKLEPEPTVDEVIRNFPIRQPALWIDPAAAPTHRG
jgi:hypothetical protein